MLLNHSGFLHKFIFVSNGHSQSWTIAFSLLRLHDDMELIFENNKRSTIWILSICGEYFVGRTEQRDYFSRTIPI